MFTCVFNLSRSTSRILRGVTCVEAQRLPSDVAGRQRPERIRSAFTTDLNPELLSETIQNRLLTDILFD
ncbi:hypothetical protein [Xenorhabdus sp. SGI246]|uniref:hypothetical protein n=1 Tax=Xenorhabdus sp. SGI246 TaxID=3158263 RepID=UPI00349F2039